MKKTMAWVALMSFLVFSWSCVVHRWGATSLESVKPEKRGQVQISAVQVRSGEKTEFRKNAPAVISQDRVVGDGYVRKIVLEKTKIKQRTSFKLGLPAQITTKDGVVYKADHITAQDESTVTFSAYVPVAIPLADIDIVWVKKVNVPATLLLDIAVPVAILVAVAAIAYSSTDSSYTPSYSYSDYAGGVSSCLLVSSHDGAGFVCDGEPYGGAICQGLQRTEWSRLDHWRETDGQYRLLGSNKKGETQYLDELKLVAVDHSPDVRVVPDIIGRLHTIRKPLPPRQAHDGDGEDISRLISRDDESFWTSRIDGAAADRDKNPKETLDLEFPKPAGARQVKIVADAWTTLLGPLAAKSLLGLYGRALPSWYEEVNSHGPAWQKMLAWYHNEELYMVQVRVQTKDGWREKEVIYGGGPLIAKEKAYPLDISDVEGEVLRIKLTPAAGFWMIDAIAADYSADLPLQAKEIGAARAVDSGGSDVRQALARTDKNYLVMEEAEDTVDFCFDAPPRAPGLNRTLILKASGYYEVHLAAEGEPRWDLVTRLFGEPGFAARYALSELGRWRAASAGHSTEH